MKQLTLPFYDSAELWTVAMMAPTVCRHGFVETSQVGCSQCSPRRPCGQAFCGALYGHPCKCAVQDSNPHTRVGY